MNGRTLSLAAILTGLGMVITFLRAQIAANPALLLVLVAIGAGMVELLLSWGYTQFYKVGNVPALKGLDDATKRLWRQRIYKRAVFSAFVVGAIEGVILLLVAADMRHMLVYAVLWTLGDALVAFSSPWLWTLVFQIALPWLLQKDPAIGVEIRRNAVTGDIESVKDQTRPDPQTEVLGRGRTPAIKKEQP